MKNRFDYKESINNIKASLFDIYEDQERLIGYEENEEQKNLRINTFIELKNNAISFIEKIEELYNDSQIENEIEKEIPIEKEKVPEENDEELNNAEIVEEYPIEEDGIKEEFTEHNNIEEKQLPKYYLNCDFNKINFAYVPVSIYEKIKKHQKPDEVEEFNEEPLEQPEEKEQKQIDNHFYKQDLDKTRGIIVRSDQYMKLALSRHRQAGVLEEAKEYRKEEVIKRQRENQKRELEKAELNFNI